MSWTVSVKVLGYLYFRPRVVTYMNQILGPVLLANCETCQVRQVNGMDITTRWTDNNCQNMNHHVLNQAFEWNLEKLPMLVEKLYNQCSK